MRNAVHGVTRERSALDEEQLLQAGAWKLAGADEVWVTMDTGDLRTRHAAEMEAMNLFTLQKKIQERTT